MPPSRLKSRSLGDVVIVAVWAARLLASYQADLPTAACASPPATGELTHNAVPIHPTIGFMV